MLTRCNKLEVALLKKHGGFTLVELAVVLIIFGLVTSAAMLGLRSYTGDRLLQQSLQAVEDTQTAISFFQGDGAEKYPCPADPTLNPGDALYGVSDCASPNLITALGRDVDGDGVGEAVLIGAVPFNTLLDPDGDPTTLDSAYPDRSASSAISNTLQGRSRNGFDGWNNKITYAVTRSLSLFDATPFNHEAGAIFIHDENDINILDQAGIAHVAIISHGANGKGARTENGSEVDDCFDISVPSEVPVAGSIPRDERDNCDYQIEATPDAEFLKGVRNETNANYNDDIVKFIVSSVSDIWVQTEGIDNDNGTPEDPSDDFVINQITNTNGGNIGLGVNNPATELHLEGDIQAFEMHVEGLCDSAGANCMPPDAIAGELADMQCPPGQVVTQIELNRVTCENPFPPSAFAPCPAGQFLTGISNVSGPICRDP